MAKPEQFTKEEKAIRHLCSNTRGLLSFIFWSIEVKPVLKQKHMEIGIYPSSLGRINESCLFHSAIMVRKFDDFFNHNGRKDDITSKMFDYEKVKIIDEPCRTQINKCLAHFTEVYITELNVDMPVVSKGIQLIAKELQAFFQHLIDNKTISNAVVCEMGIVIDNLKTALVYLENPKN